VRPLRLELRGFTAFRNETVVDFSERHLFAITGPTGAGKSSLLDAMTWALYGRVPRVGREATQLRSHGAPTMAVQFDFRVGPQAYRVTRRVGKTMAVRLEREEAPGNFRPIADKATEVGTEIERILGLDYDTFTKTVLLPQGAFDAFLRGEPRERRAILTNLLGLGVYQAMRERAGAQAAGAGSASRALLQQAEHLADTTPEAIAAAEAERDALIARRETVRQQRERLGALTTLERKASERAHDAAAATSTAVTARQAETQAREALAEAEAALAAATTHLDTLAAERPTLGYDRAAHEALRQQAEQLVQRQRAREELAAAEAASVQAHEVLTTASATTTAAEAAAKRQRTQLSKTAKAHEAARTSLADAVGVATRTVALLTEARTRLDASRAEAERQAAEAEERVRLIDALAKQANDAAAEIAAADEAVQRTTAQAAIAEAERVRAEAAAEAASTALDAARAARDRANREHAAADLRRGLRVGDICPVCGEPIAALAEHTAPDLDAAEAAVQAAEAVLRDAQAAQQQRAAAAATEHARVEAARATFDAAQRRRDAVARACADAGVAPDALDALDAERGRAASAVTIARASIAETTQRAGESAERARTLELLLATVPAEVATAAAESLATPDAAEADIEPLLRGALDAYRDASSTTQAAEAAQRAAEEVVRTAATEHAHAAERATAAIAVVEAAQARLAALPAPQHEDGEALLAALAAAEAAAARDAAIEEETRSAGQQQAAAASRLDDRGAAVVAATAEAQRAGALAEAAGAAAEAAAATYADQWRVLHDVTSAPDAELIARWDVRVREDEVRVATDLAGVEARLQQARTDAARAVQLHEEVAGYERRGALAQALELDLRSDRFIAFVQREAMQVLASEAADRMEHLSRGRYRMRTDGDEFVVIDRLNGDEQRSVKTLSGGETFLASLALALALAERLPQLSGHGAALSLESLFLDEGFGTLDADALDVAIEALELLASERRMIGVISHVPLIAERLPDRIEVVRTGSGSTVRG
jgi:exonuclease SbcC